MRSVIFYGIILMFFCGPFMSQKAFADIHEDKAGTYFENKQYQEAIEIWQDILVSGKVTSGIYYNIGLAESRLGNTPKAMLAFEKALRLSPSSKTIKKAILKEKEKIENAIIPVKPFFLAEWVKLILAIFRPGYWAFFGLLTLTFVIIRYIRKNIRKSISFIPGRIDLLLAAAGLLFLVFSFLSYTSLYRKDEAILQKECTIHQAPNEDSPQLTMIHPGEKIIILDQLSGWHNVRLPNLEEGWVSTDCLSLIQMGTP